MLRMTHLVHLKQLLKELESFLRELERPRCFQVFITHALVVPKLPPQLQIQLVPEVLEQLPAALPLHLLNVLLHQDLEEVEVYSLQRLGLVLLFVGDELLECRQVDLFHLVVVHIFLEVDDVLVVHVPVTVLITDPEDSQQGSLELRLDLLFHGIVEGSDRIENCELGRDDYIDQVQEHLG